MIKKVLSTLLMLFIIAICPLTAFASVATPSELERISVASSSEVSKVYSNFFEDFVEVDSFDTLANTPVLMSSGEEGLVYGTDYVYRVRYRNSSNILKWVNATYSNGFYKFTPPSSDYWPDMVYAQVYKGGLPSASGTYGLTATFLQGDIDFGDYISSGFCEVYEADENVTESAFTATGLSYTNTGDTYVIKGNVKVTRYSIRANIGFMLNKGVNPTFNISDLSFDFYFKANDGVAVSGNTGYDSTDVIADNTAIAVEQGDTIIELIKNTIQTISYQLTAFWNQLAGEFTNLYNKLNQQHAEQLEADRTNTDDIIAAEESNTTNIINNNNQNTEKIVNGYDSSAQDQKNEELGNKLNEYDSAESEIFDSVSDNISDFNISDYEINDSSLLAGIIWVSGFLQELFVSMGMFNLPVTISLVLIFVVIMIGYYRVRN